MATSRLQEFLDGAGGRPYRELIQYHIRRTPARRLQEAAMGEAALCPVELPDQGMEFIDAINAELGYDKHFWDTATCHEALDRVVSVAMQATPLGMTVRTLDDALLPANHESVFCLFQIATLSFAYSASLQRKQRKFMGIRKGILG
jgi:hypothetical protein